MSLNWAKNHPPESIASMAEKLRNRPKTEEHKKKLSEANKKKTEECQ
jgi:hypothetical protein